MYDAVIKNAIIADGSGSKLYNADVGIKGKTIAYIGILDDNAQKIIDCENKYILSPGFIDTHSHTDFYVFYDSTLKYKMLQGITTDISGNCGLGAAPVSQSNFAELKKYVNTYTQGIDMPGEWGNFDVFSKYLGKVEQLNPGINVGYQLAQGTVRIAVMGLENREATAKEMENMKEIVRSSMQSGCFGMSTGLIYPPGLYTNKEEITELCKVVAEYDGVYATHIRNESQNVIESVAEAIDIGRKSGVKVIISHHKAIGRENEDKIDETLKLIDEANNEGITVCMDRYPYGYGATRLATIIPPPYHAGGVEKLIERLKDKQTRKEIKDYILDENKTWENLYRFSGSEGIIILSAKSTKDVDGKTLRQYAKEIDKKPLDAAFEILIQNSGAVSSAFKLSSDKSIDKVILNPRTMIGTDSDLLGEEYKCHPRAIGSFPKFLGEYVREKKLLSIEEAVRKITSMPAQVLGIKNKGLISIGYDADLVIFDKEKIKDNADFINPYKHNDGIKYVIVNGKIAAKDNVILNGANGKVLRSFDKI